MATGLQENGYRGEEVLEGTQTQQMSDEVQVIWCRQFVNKNLAPKAIHQPRATVPSMSVGTESQISLFLLFT